MAGKKIIIDIEVNGKMQKATVSVNKLKKALDNTKKSEDAAAKSARELDRNLKGASQQSANGTKNFSKMAQGIGGTLVPAYATLAANIFAVTAAFNAFRRAAQVEQLESNLVRLGNVAGQNLRGIADDLKNITDNAIDSETALRAVAQGTTQGFSSSQLQDLTRIAKGASIALGRELPDALDRLIRGTAKLEPEILDELGIIVRLDDAADKYATTLGKTANQLTAYEKQQAFANAVAEQGLKKFGAVAALADSNPYDQLNATFQDLSKNLFEFLNTVLEPIVKFLAMNPTGLVGVVALFATTIISQLTPALAEVAEKGRQNFSMLAKQAKKAAADIETKYGRALKNLKKSELSPKGFKAVEAAIRSGTASTRQFEQAVKSLKIADTRRTNEIKKMKLATKDLAGTQRTAHLAYIAQKEKELAVIQAQLAATQALKGVEGTRKVAGGTGGILGGQGGAQRRAVNTGANARIGRTEAAASRLMQRKGVFGQFKVAGAASAKMAGQVGRASGALGKFSAAGKVAAASARLFGSALLNAIPIIGQVLFFGTLLWEMLTGIFGSPFDKSPAEEAVESLKEKMKELEEGAQDVRRAMRNAGSATEAEFIRLTASGGQADQAVAGIRNIVDAQTSAEQEKLGNLRSKAAGDFDYGLFSFERTGDREAARKSLQTQNDDGNPLTIFVPKESEIKAEMKRLAQVAVDAGEEALKNTKIDKSSALQAIAAVDNALKASGVASKAVTDLTAKARADIRDMPEVTSDFLENLANQIEAAGQDTNNWTKAFGGLNDAISNTDSAFNKFVRKSSTPFTELLQTGKALEGTFMSIAKIPQDADFGAAGLTTDAADKLLAGQSPDALNLAAKLRESDAYKDAEGNEFEKLNAAYSNYVKKLEDADDTFRKQKATLDKIKTSQKEISQFTKTSSFFYAEDVKLQKDSLAAREKLNQASLDILETQKETVTVNEDGTKTVKVNQDVVREINRLTEENNALEKEAKAIQDDKVALAQVEFNEKKRALDIQNKMFAGQQKLLDIEQQRQDIADKREMREAKRTAFFDFIDQGALALQQQREKETANLGRIGVVDQATGGAATVEDKEGNVVYAVSEAQKQIDAGKIAVIQAEYALLRARIETEQQILLARKTKQDADGDGTVTEAEQTAATEAGIQAENLGGILENLTTAETAAVSAVGAATQAKIAAVEETIAAIGDAETELQPIEQIMNTIENSLASGIQNAIQGIIDGSMNMKQAFASMAQGILQALAQVIAQLIAVKILKMAIGGPLGALFGDGGVATPPSAAYGGVMKPPSFDGGGIAGGGKRGYPAILHGTEAVVPLPNKKEIPVDIRNGAQNQENNVTVNVSVDNQGGAQTQTQSDGQEAASMGEAIARAVQQELQNQKRSGGILNPYGVA